MTILHIDSSARFTDSTSRLLTQYLCSQLDDDIIKRDLAVETLPAFSAEDLMDMHHSREIPRDSLVEHQTLSRILVEELKAADTLVIGIPIYNFSVPAVLKRWVDYVVRLGSTFRYGENGQEGLCDIKRAFLVTSSGGTTIGGPNDFASQYIEHICRFIGVEDVHHIAAGGSKKSKEQIIDTAKQQIQDLLVVA